MKNLLACFVLPILFLSACKTPPPTYKYPNPASTDPKISFESDFDLHTHFSVNTKAPEENQCSDFDRAGYLLKVDSFTIYDKPNRNLEIHTAAEKPISVSAYHSFSDGSHSVQCGPLSIMFVPEKMKEYKVKLNLKEKICFMSVQASDGDGSWLPVKPKILPKCHQ